ncbi:hypothetical protein EJK17_09675 [Lactobacillus xujianguonis]|uniref:Protein kinase domain-containing protein n=2 Tax=Lactobacillaceae TaxID=33958 RepID=A0A437SSZ5_9LACO|nr:hypothetical protein EJK17_09675 [Lactobacillus xujianguonis]
MQVKYMEDEISIVLQKNHIVSQDRYWAYPENESFYKYSKDKVGVKIHLSATVINYKTILKRFLKWNKKHRIGFKVCKSLKVLERLNQGLYGYSQTGKFITLYPVQDTDYLNKVLVSLYKLFNDLYSVDIPSDVSFLSSGVVYIRYGEFVKNQTIFLDKRNGLIPDVAKEKIFALNFEKYYVMPKNLKIFKLIRKSSKGGVYLAWNSNLKKIVLLKEATKNARMTLSGEDSVLSLYSEIQLLREISNDNYNFIPNYINSFWLENSLFLEEEYIEGETIDDIIRNDFKKVKLVLDYFRNLLLVVCKIHKFNNYIIHDVSPANIIFSKNRFYLIDFETLSKSNEKLTTIYGTNGFVDSMYKSNDKTVDYYALAKVYYYLNNPDKYKELSTLSLKNKDVKTKNNLWLKRCIKHSYSNDEAWLEDYDKYIGAKNEISKNQF